MSESRKESGPEPRRADQIPRGAVRFSICTLVTDLGEYAEMVESFRERGFSGPDCEFLYLDNSAGNAFDAFSGYNLFLSTAAGDYLILCHQDILLLEQGRAALEDRLAELDRLDPAWALCGNAGGAADGSLALRITDPHGTDQSRGRFPVRALALDENFIVARRDANLGLSHDLGGFHLYGADLCIVADLLGRTAYVVDFHLRHKSAGNIDERFYAARRALIAKYRRAFRPRWIRTTCTNFLVSGTPLLGRILSTRLGRLFRR
ncbi:MAG TPA: hypothetical protein VE053_15350 [Allosphingosinicella sp.]|nr:hypothetical protein [Allosphingosinicella sp.]